MFHYATSCCSCHYCHCLSATNCDYTEQRLGCLSILLSIAHSKVYTVDYTPHSSDNAQTNPMVQSLFKYVLHVSHRQVQHDVKKNRLFVRSVQLCRAYFNIIALRFEVFQNRLFCFSWIKRPDKVTHSGNSYTFYQLLHRRAVKHKTYRLSLLQPTAAANRGRQVYISLHNKVTELENANKISPSS